ncbi:hypothetical protein SUGI_0084960 [Cryptomeria japonica]|uniref:1,4-dihydroxy-2-naphthoyl-CoA thioesterase 1 n=1 Tax=Cryptomeria japonica TaxID=3369 RepID=UPI002408C1AA|nr:1,4-dihydroxy-2-naphthoyl-CoA thioesterase 1 [Cryptomeria japonica]GLJ08258.1 hypothetical protein SUGI_0084960 [Cryptomeria japonica]
MASLPVVVGDNMDWKKGERNAPYGHKLSPVLSYIGFELETVTPTCIQGRFVVSERSAQAYGVLHGGISAFIAESLGSFGASLASGLQKVAGVELSISHLQPGYIGLEIVATATPIHIGRRLHVWEIKFTSAASSPNGSSKTPEPGLIAVSKLTVTLLPSHSATKSEDDKRISSKL